MFRFAVGALTAAIAALTGCSSRAPSDPGQARPASAVADAELDGFGPSFDVRDLRVHFYQGQQYWTALNGALVTFGDGKDASGLWRRGLWRTDGVTRTLLRGELNPGADPFDRSIFAELDGVLYFPARDFSRLGTPSVFDVELWRTDGTPEGTFLVRT